MAVDYYDACDWGRYARAGESEEQCLDRLAARKAYALQSAGEYDRLSDLVDNLLALTDIEKRSLIDQISPENPERAAVLAAGLGLGPEPAGCGRHLAWFREEQNRRDILSKAERVRANYLAEVGARIRLTRLERIANKLERYAAHMERVAKAGHWVTRRPRSQQFSMLVELCDAHGQHLRRIHAARAQILCESGTAAPDPTCRGSVIFRIILLQTPDLASRIGPARPHSLRRYCSAPQVYKQVLDYCEQRLATWCFREGKYGVVYLDDRVTNPHRIDRLAEPRFVPVRPPLS